MKLELDAGYNSDRMFRRPRWGRIEFGVPSSGQRFTVYWFAVLGLYVELTIERGEA